MKKQIVYLIDDKLTLEVPYPSLRITADESHKTIETVMRIWDFLLENHITRKGLMVCVGGGVLTDIGGFAAATFKRGIEYINIPTTLLAMVDASSGGKTGINYGGLKNSIGCFAAPKETVIDVKWLKSLPTTELHSGFGEMLKTGLIESKEDRKQEKGGLWESLLQYDLASFDVEKLTPLIERCVAVKKRIVAEDPHEEGLRKVLNFGHTFGHAIEEITLSNERLAFNGQMAHGYAVVYGMIAELYLSVTKLGCPKKPLQQLTQVMLHYYGRPNCNCKDSERLIALMQEDKKNECAGDINCTLLQDIGSPVINQAITAEEAKEALEYLFSL